MYFVYDYSYPYHPASYEQYVRTSVAQDMHLLKDIQKAIHGEYSAIACYKRLAELASRQEEAERIREIREDERRHFEAFRKIYVQLTGRQPTLQITEDCPNEYRAGLHAAFKDEQETVDFYLDIADRVRDHTIREAFRRAAADEQHHAVWFLYFMTAAAGNPEQKKHN